MRRAQSTKSFLVPKSTNDTGSRANPLFAYTQLEHGRLRKNRPKEDLPMIKINDDSIVVSAKSEMNLKSLSTRREKLPSSDSNLFSEGLQTVHPAHSLTKDFTSVSTGHFSATIFQADSSSKDSSSPSVFSNSSDSESSIFFRSNRKEDTPFTDIEFSLEPRELSQFHDELTNRRSSFRLQSDLSPSYVNNHDKKRLVNQFLESSNTPFMERLKPREKSENSNTPSNSSSSIQLNIGGGKQLTKEKLFESLLQNEAGLAPFTREGNESSRLSRLSFNLDKSFKDKEMYILKQNEMSKSDPQNNLLSVKRLQRDDDDRRNVGSKVNSGVNLAMNCNEFNYSHKHIQKQLAMAEVAIKDILNDVAFKDSEDFQNGLQEFDSLGDEVKKIKESITEIKYLVQNNYLTLLDNEFDKNNSESFISKVDKMIIRSIDQLDDIEGRHRIYKDNISKHKEVLRKMESLLATKPEQKLNRNSRFSIYYLYILLDLTVFLIVISAFFIMVGSIWN